MRVLFFASIRECTKEKEIRWDEPAGTLGDLLAALSARYGRAFERWVLEGGELGRAIIVSVNGRDARHLDGVKTALRPADTVSIFPAIAGGGPSAAAIAAMCAGQQLADVPLIQASVDPCCSCTDRYSGPS